MTNSVSYAFFQNAGDLPVMRDKVTIKGGANIPSIKNGFGDMSQDEEGIPIWTPQGVVTSLKDERYALVKDHPLFKKHIEKGVLKIINHDISGDHKAVKKHLIGMTASDDYAQLTPATLKKKTSVKMSTQSIDSDVQFKV